MGGYESHESGEKGNEGRSDEDHSNENHEGQEGDEESDEEGDEKSDQEVQDCEGQVGEGNGVEGLQGENVWRLEEGQPEEKQGWKNRLQGCVGPRQKGLRGQRHPEVEQGRPGGEEEPELDGHDTCRWKDSSGPRLVRQGQGALQRCLRLEGFAWHLMVCCSEHLAWHFFFSCVAACCSVFLAVAE